MHIRVLWVYSIVHVDVEEILFWYNIHHVSYHVCIASLHTMTFLNSWGEIPTSNHVNNWMKFQLSIILLPKLIFVRTFQGELSLNYLSEISHFERIHPIQHNLWEDSRHLMIIHPKIHLLCEDDDNSDVWGLSMSSFLMTAKEISSKTQLKLRIVGGFNPFEKYARQNWKSSPGNGENKKCLKPPPFKRVSYV